MGKLYYKWVVELTDSDGTVIDYRHENTYDMAMLVADNFKFKSLQNLDTCTYTIDITLTRTNKSGADSNGVWWYAYLFNHQLPETFDYCRNDKRAITRFSSDHTAVKVPRRFHREVAAYHRDHPASSSAT